MHILQSRRALVLVTSAAVAAGIGLGVAPAAQAANGKVTIANTLPRWLGHASKSAVTPFAATTQTVRVYLTPNGGANALNAAVAAVSDPSSAQYRQFFTSAQYDAKYAPTQAQVDQVSGYLSGAVPADSIGKDSKQDRYPVLVLEQKRGHGIPIFVVFARHAGVGLCFDVQVSALCADHKNGIYFFAIIFGSDSAGGWLRSKR